MNERTVIILQEVSEAVGLIRRVNNSKLSDGIKNISEGSEKIEWQVESN